MKWIAIGIVLIVSVAVGNWWYDGYRAQSALLAQPVYRVLKKYERPVYDKLLQEYQHFQRGESQRETFINVANAEISMAATQRLGRASEDSVLALMHDMLSTARALAGKPDDSCFRYWFPLVSGPPDIARNVDAAAQANTLNLMANVIESAAREPAALPEPDSVKDDLARVINDTYEQYGTDAQMIARADDPDVDRAKVCTITISVYERILKLPPADSSALIRAMTQLR